MIKVVRFPDCHRSDGVCVEHLRLLQLPEHGGLQRVEEGPGGVRGLLESGNGQFWCEGKMMLVNHTHTCPVTL